MPLLTLIFIGVAPLISVAQNPNDGPAEAKANCTPGARDAGNHGMLPEHFLVRINQKIARRRRAGCGKDLPEEHAYLTLEEVLAVSALMTP